MTKERERNLRRIIFGAAAMIALATTSAASAHDFFLMPDQFRVPDASAVKISATVGSNFPKAENTVDADRVDRLLAVGAGSPKVRVTGATATALGLEVTDAKNGMLVTGVSTKARDVDYAEDRIPLILEEYRVRPAAAAAVAKLPRPRNWKVSSRRYAKTFVCVRTCANDVVSARATGASLEFVGRSASFEHFRLLGGGKPLVNYPVDLVGQDGKRQHLTTDRKGDVHLSAGTRGTIMLFAAVLELPRGSERFTLDLTSLTFHRP